MLESDRFKSSDAIEVNAIESNAINFLPNEVENSLNRAVKSELFSEISDEPERAMRPKSLASYIGQTKIKEQLNVFLSAAQMRGMPLDHCLLFGPPGLGKTTLAQIIANELSAQIKVTSGPVIDKAGDLAALLTNLQQGDVLFIDEIHRLSPHVEEILYSAMEDYCIDIMIGDGAAARSIRIDIPPFTLIGATTRAGALTAPLRDRFGITLRLEYYSCLELQKIVLRSSQCLCVSIEDCGAIEIARRSRGTPRIANRLLKRVADFALIKNNNVIDEVTAKNALDMLNIDQQGLDDLDRKLLKVMKNQFDGGPVGINSLAVALGEDHQTIEDVCEPYLVQEGFIKRTARGRELLDKAYLYFSD